MKTLSSGERIRNLHQKALLAAFGQLRDWHGAEDAAQDALVSYWRKKLAGEVFEKTSALVRALGRRKAIDLIRREGKHHAVRRCGRHLNRGCPSPGSGPLCP